MLLGRKTMTNLGKCIKKQRHHFANPGPYSHNYGFPSSRVCMCELDHKEGWGLKSWCFRTMVLEKTLESPLDCKEIQPSIPKEKIPEYSLEGLMLKLKLQLHLMGRTDLLEKTLMLGKSEGRRRRGWQRLRWLDGITDSWTHGKDWLDGLTNSWHHWTHRHEFGWTPGVGDGQGGLVCCGPWGR